MEDGPARRSGMRWGDTILAVNGIDVKEKSDAEIEMLLSSERPKRIKVSVDRASVKTTFTFELERAATVLRDNHWQLVQGKFVPLWAPERYWHCF